MKKPKGTIPINGIANAGIGRPDSIHACIPKAMPTMGISIARKMTGAAHPAYFDRAPRPPYQRFQLSACDCSADARPIAPPTSRW